MRVRLNPVIDHNGRRVMIKFRIQRGGTMAEKKKDEEKTPETVSITTDGREYRVPVDVEEGSMRHGLEKIQHGPAAQAMIDQARKRRRAARGY
jgi:hypothetical protein